MQAFAGKCMVWDMGSSINDLSTCFYGSMISDPGEMGVKKGNEKGEGRGMYKVSILTERTSGEG